MIPVPKCIRCVLVFLLTSTVFTEAAQTVRIDGLLVLDGEGRTVLAWATTGLLSRSNDGGKHWTHLTGPTGIRLALVTLERNRRSVLFAESFAESGGLVYASTDQGTTWQNLPTNNEEKQEPLPALDLHNPTFLYAALRDKIVYSTDSGKTWRIFKPDIPSAVIYRMWIDPRNAQSLYAGGLLRGIYHSTDGGVTWIGISGIPVFSNAPVLYFDPADPNTIYLQTGPIYIESSEGDLYKSVDEGRNWAVIQSRIDFFAIIPGDLPVLFAGVWFERSHRNDFTLLTSTDRGKEWVNANAGLPTTGRVVTLVSAPTDRSNLYAANEYGRVFKSTNFGKSWMSVRFR